MINRKFVLLPAAALLVVTGCAQGDSVTALPPEEAKATADSIKKDYEDGNVKLPEKKAYAADFNAGANVDVSLSSGFVGLGSGTAAGGLGSTSVKGSFSVKGSASAFDTDDIKAADISAKAGGSYTVQADLSSLLGTSANTANASTKVGLEAEFDGEISDAAYYGYTVSTTQSVSGQTLKGSKGNKVKRADYGFSAFKKDIALSIGLDSLDGYENIPPMSDSTKKAFDHWIDKMMKLGSEASEDMPFLVSVGTMKNGNIVFNAIGNPAYASKAGKDGIFESGNITPNFGSTTESGTFQTKLTPGKNAVLSASARLVLAPDYLPVSFSAGFALKNFTVDYSLTSTSSEDPSSASQLYNFTVNEVSAHFSVSFRYGTDATRAYELKEADKAAYKEAQ